MVGEDNGRVKIAVLAEQNKLMMVHIDTLTRQVREIHDMLRSFTGPDGTCDRRFARTQKNESAIGEIKAEMRGVKRAIGVIIGMLATILAVVIHNAIVNGNG